MKIIIFIVAVYILLTVFLYLLQRRMLYYPTPPVNHGFNNFFLESGGEKIEVIVVNPGRDKACIYFGGNAESVGDTAFMTNRSIPNCYTVYLVNYRGYGKSSGSPSEKGLYQDALSLYDKVAENHEKIAAMGRSLGTSVATFLAANRKVSKLVLVTPFDSIVNVAKKSFPFFPVSVLMKDRHESVNRAENIDIPTLFLIAGRDQVIPGENSMALYRAFNKDLTTIVSIDMADHNDISMYKEYERAVGDFLRTSEKTCDNNG